MDEDLLVNDEPETSTARAIHGEKQQRELPHIHGVRSSEATADFAPKTVSSTDLIKKNGLHLLKRQIWSESNALKSNASDVTSRLERGRLELDTEFLFG